MNMIVGNNMIKFIRSLLGLCDHKWKILNTSDMYANQYNAMPYARKYALQCEHCGNIKKKVV